MKKLFLDIETLPAPGDKMEILKDLWEDSRKKIGNSTKIIKGVNDFDTFFRNTSFQGEFGRIFCIAYAIDNQPVEVISGDEKEILKKFWDIAKECDLFVGHNIMEFDLRFIFKRSVILGVKPTKELSFARYRNNPIFDSLCEWEKWASRGCGLHKLSLALGLQSPKSEGIDGSQVYDFFLAGKTDEILEYCKRDVDTTRKVYKRITFDR